MAQKVDLYMPVRGELLPLNEVNNYLAEDSVDGLGVGILPQEDLFYAPVSGEVVLVGENHNVVGIAVTPELTILLHCGIHCEGLEGRGFSSYVRVGDQVTLGDKLLYMDRDYVSNHGDPTTPLIISNRTGVRHVNIDYSVTDIFQKFMEIHLK
ncbi:hypothetical protein ABB02_01543 [Clostridiaceae bacterium JG1575]|nr:hypothetical protein ABB02_01543 [Clostridiaceae bacterium JG1575]